MFCVSSNAAGANRKLRLMFIYTIKANRSISDDFRFRTYENWGRQNGRFGFGKKLMSLSSHSKKQIVYEKYKPSEKQTG